MNIKDILAKLAKGDALTDAEKTFLSEFDPEKTANSAAAAARKTAEKERDSLKAKLAEVETQLEEAGNAGKSEVEQLKAQVAKLTKSVETANAESVRIAGEKKALLRGTKLDRILGTLKFVDGVDASLPRLALERALADLKDEDLDSDEAIKPIVEGFTAKNKAILLDQSGGGVGTPPKDGGRGGSGTVVDASKMTDQQRAAHLRKQK